MANGHLRLPKCLGGPPIVRSVKRGTRRRLARIRRRPKHDPSWTRPDLAQLFQLYKVCMARVVVRDAKGDLANGAAFHIGDGYLVTARHVVEHGAVELVEPEQAMPRALTIAKTFVADDPRIDLAVLETDFSLEHFLQRTTIVEGEYVRPRTDFIPLGDHLDDWLGDEPVLSGVLTMVYPRIPLSSGTRLIASTGEVNGVIDRYDEPHVHFVVSTLGRGGFSGGPVISEFGFCSAFPRPSWSLTLGIPVQGCRMRLAWSRFSICSTRMGSTRRERPVPPGPVLGFRRAFGGRSRLRQRQVSRRCGGGHPGRSRGARTDRSEARGESSVPATEYARTVVPTARPDSSSAAT